MLNLELYSREFYTRGKNQLLDAYSRHITVVSLFGDHFILCKSRRCNVLEICRSLQIRVVGRYNKKEREIQKHVADWCCAITFRASVSAMPGKWFT